ncbi:ankyrin repeat and SOCS box protein 15 [Cephus cinctus]|uniref:Ankyrin repeat and SOCS box protein 15 n=1 Tax=Cephus cinctus TaxID=211228 RepID=A0AAJ7BIB8_CEPCN|nr:ankyrin repeat and SOCS box protein 15 [Cephus cinctus]XP_015586739.1 ankyrin repeat and SOCS box protein 15 [Cephus cinctus]XP_015586740.1 ankyrin repeat and SOCS box protein 15 [Cephus cinctus]
MTAAHTDEPVTIENEEVVKKTIIATMLTPGGALIMRKSGNICLEEPANSSVDEERISSRYLASLQQNACCEETKEFAEFCEKFEASLCDETGCESRGEMENKCEAANSELGTAEHVAMASLRKISRSSLDDLGNTDVSESFKISVGTVGAIFPGDDSTPVSETSDSIEVASCDEASFRSARDLSGDTCEIVQGTVNSPKDRKIQQESYQECWDLNNCTEIDLDTDDDEKTRADTKCNFASNVTLKEQIEEIEKSVMRNTENGRTGSGVPKQHVFEAVNSTLRNMSYVITRVPIEDKLEEIYDPEEDLSFHEAVRTGDVKSVAMLVARGVVKNLDEPDWNVSGDPPLLVAATNHCLPVLSALLSSGCDPAARSPRGETALHRAILNGGLANVLKFVEELLNHGCPPGVKEAGGGLTALHVFTRQLAYAQGSRSLHHNFQEAVKTLDLLAKAGPVNARDHQGRSALHILASSSVFDSNHRTEIEALIKRLLEAGADPALKNDRGETPLHECLECGALNTALLLMPHTPVDITSRYGETPLHIAARKNQLEMVARLLEHGEDPSLQDAGGNTPLHLASARGFHQIVSLLVTSPLAQLEKVNDEGLTSLQVAAESGFVNAVKLLLKAGADPSQTAHYCTTTFNHRHPDISILIDHELTRRRQLAA